MRRPGAADRQNLVVSTRLVFLFESPGENRTLRLCTPSFLFGGRGNISFHYILHHRLVLSSLGVGFVYILGLLAVDTRFV